MQIDVIRGAVAKHITNRPVILVGADLDRFSQHIHELRSMGARKVLIVSSGLGVGAIPNVDGFEVAFVDVSEAANISHAEAAWQQVFQAPPPWLERMLASFDPHGEAAVIPWRFRTSTTFGERPVYGPRIGEAVRLEDKTRIGAFLSGCGIGGPPGAQTVLAELGELQRAAADLDYGRGTVWSGDASEATNSGTKFVRWVRNADDCLAAATFFASHCREVRVAPFLEGVACGMHALVTRHGVSVFRPVELLILRPECGSTFIDAGFATTFDPDAADTAAYRLLVDRIGRELWKQFGYEGAISVDAILTERGWVVHDINPRQGGGLVYFRDALPDLPIHLAHHVAAAGDLPPIDMQALERLVLDASDRTRVIASALTLNGGPGSSFATNVPVGDELIPVRYTPGSAGRNRLVLAPQLQVGERVAPRVAAAVTAVRFDIGLDLAVTAPLCLTQPQCRRVGQLERATVDRQPQQVPSMEVSVDR